MLSDPTFIDQLRANLAANSAFAAETERFDGSILLEAPGARCWLKIYCGQVIDCRAEVPVFGYTFKLTGEDSAWRMLIGGERSFPDLITGGTRRFADPGELAAASNLRPPELRTEGNLLEASRLHEALHHLADSVVAAGRGSAGLDG